jgi:formiminoglutamase
VVDDPNWPRASAWLAGRLKAPPVARLALLGAPLRMGSLSGGRFDLAPGAVREALDRFSTYDAETGMDIGGVAVRDEGDLALAGSSPEEALTPLAGAVGGSLDAIDAVVVLGGDNSVTRPAVRGLGPDLARVGLLTLDAHFDLRDTDGGLSNGNPVRALLEDGLPGQNVIQVGIQPFANSPSYAAVAREAGIRAVTADEVRRRGIETVMRETLDGLAKTVDTVYVDFDLDVLDRAFAPACPGSRPGGLTPMELRAAARACGAHPKVRAVDLVEVDPTQDVADVTVLAAASCLLAFAGGMAAR